MTFLELPFLLASLAAAIPVILHMINRQKVKDLPFPTLRFLKISVQKTRRRKRIHDVLLMLLRAAVLVLIAFGLAKPTVTHLGSLLAGGARAAVVIILDNSASMGMIDPERMRFDVATGAARQILDELQDGDLVALWLTGGPIQGEDKLERSQEKALQLLNEARVSYQRADLARLVHRARELLAASTAVNKQIYVISDFQAISWEGLHSPSQQSAEEGQLTDEQLKALRIPVICVDCNRAPKPNVAIQRVTLETAVPVAGVPVKAIVELFNAATVQQAVVVELHVDGTKIAASPAISVAPGGTATHEFSFAFDRGGLHRGEVRLAGSDGSSLDNRRFFAMEIDQGIPVAIVKPARHEIPYLEDTYYLELALAPGQQGQWALRVSTLTASELANEPLDKYKVIYCVNLPAPSEETAQRLRSYVERRGNLVWFGGDNVRPEAYNLMNQQAGGTLLPAPLLEVRAAGSQVGRDSWHIAQLDKQYPAFKTLLDPPSLYTTVLAYKHIRIDAGASPAARVLARLDDGEPLLVEREVGQGKVIFIGTGAHVNWTNLPLRPIFLPLVARLTFSLAGVEHQRYDTLAGTPLELALPEEAAPVSVEVLPPGGETFRLRSQGAPDGKGQVFRYENTYDPGVYVLRVLDSSQPLQVPYSVNVDPDEALPEKIDRQQLQQQFGITPLVWAEDPEDLSSTFKALREGQSLWGLFLTAVLVALVFEALVSNRLTPKPEEQAKPLSTGLPRGRPVPAPVA